MRAEDDAMGSVMGNFVPSGWKEGGWWKKPAKFVVMLVTWAKGMMP